MAVTAKAYLNGIKGLNNGTIDWDDNSTTTIKCALCTNAYVPDQDAHDFFNDVSASEVSGTGYTAGGKAITTRAVNLDTTNNYIELDGDDVSWTGATFTARYAIVYKDTGTSTTSPLIGYVDFGADVPVSAGTFSITWDATGIVRYTAS